MDNEIFETVEVEEIPVRPYPPVWYAMTDENDRIVDIRSSEQIYPVNPDVWHELDMVVYGTKNPVYDEDGNEIEIEIEDDTVYISTLYDDSGALLYKLVDGEVVERTPEERAADIPEPVPAPPGNAELADTLLEQAEYILDLDFRTSCLELGIY